MHTINSDYTRILAGGYDSMDSMGCKWHLRYTTYIMYEH